MGIHFAQPQWLWALTLVPVALLLLVLTARSKRSTFAVGNPVLVGASQGPWTFQSLPWAVRLLVLSLCLLAAARPQAGKKKVEHKKPVVDLFVALDVSSSMLADDLKPNRISAAKKILSEFLDQVEGARVGLAVFAGRSFTQCPLTTDMAVVQQLLRNVEVFSVRLDGTAIGDGLASCLNRLRKGTGTEGSKPSEPIVAGNPATAGSQAIILITDGENNQGSIEPLQAALLAAREGVTVYTIGVGTPEGVPAPYVMPDGRISYAMDEKGDIIRTHLEEKPLKEIARMTGGLYFRASDNRSLSDVLSSIAKMQKREMLSVASWEYRELAPAILLGAFLLLAVDFILGLTVLRTLP